MINNLYIFNTAGKLLFSKNWNIKGSVEEDPVLVSGFLSAIWMFAQKISIRELKSVRAIQTEDRLLVGIASPTYNLLFVLVGDPGADIGACKSLLARLRQSFLKTFRKTLTSEPDFRSEDFNSWLKNAEKIIQDTDLTTVESAMKRILKGLADKTKEEGKK